MDRLEEDDCDPREKRKHPRVSLDVLLDFRISDEPKGSTGIVINASESGLLFQSFKSVPVGSAVKIDVSFSTGTGSKEQFSATARVVWKDLYLWEDLEGYQYGLRFLEVPGEEDMKLKRLLDCRKEPT
jgi:hypothetical protein